MRIAERLGLRTIDSQDRFNMFLNIVSPTYLDIADRIENDTELLLRNTNFMTHKVGGKLQQATYIMAVLDAVARLFYNNLVNHVESLAVYTVPSSFVRSWHRPFPTDYARVVGLRPAGSDTVWALQPAVGDSSGSATANDASERTLQVDANFAFRVSDYFLTHLTEPATNRGNCHYFGRWMIGAVDGAVTPDLSEPVNLVNDGTFVGRGVLELGQRGVIGSRFRGFPRAPHSIVGLGAGDECIQVMSPEGYLGITRYDAIYDYYSVTGPAAESGDYSDFGLYV